MKTIIKKDEKIILTTKQHWLVLILPILILVLGILLSALESNYGIYIIPITLCYLIYKIVERSNNIWVVTTLRVIDEFGVFSNNSKESPLDKINNVSYNQSFFGKIFGYGNIQIQTAAERGSTIYQNVEDPRRLKDTITQMQESYKQQQIKTQASELANAFAAGQQNNKPDVISEIEHLFELKQKGIITEDEFINRKTKILGS